jgi:hypothetical protein
MTPIQLESILQAAFEACESAGYPLGLVQKQILRQTLTSLVDQLPTSAIDSDTVEASASTPPPAEEANPLDELTPEQRQTLLTFIQDQKSQNRPWKAQLLNDWLQSRDSGKIQFVREQYGLRWLERVKPTHLAKYADETAIPLKVGDRIEVSNSLWEWVQDEGPCSQEWFPCIVISLTEAAEPSAIAPSGYSRHTNCIVRFDNGMEYEMQGVYEWNRYNWRWHELNGKT